MIKKNTVFVLGAGASSDFGYPLGNKLRDKIIDVFSNDDTAIEELANALYKPSDKKVFTDIDPIRGPLSKATGVDFSNTRDIKIKIKEFAKHLHDDVDYSIDIFLERFKNKYLTIGKMAIAYVLAKCENHDISFNNDNWYRCLYKKMKIDSTFDTFNENKISFITFNSFSFFF